MSESFFVRGSISSQGLVEFTPTELTAGGTLLYNADHLAYQNRNDLNLYKNNNLESTFIEIANPNKSNIIVRCIYRLDLFEFIHYYLSLLLEKLAKEQATVFLVGEFNVDLLKYEQYKAANEFRDSLSSNMFLPHVLHPTKITSYQGLSLIIFFPLISLKKQYHAI